jgi:hypothetical protein
MGIKSPWAEQMKQNTTGIGYFNAFLFPNPSKYNTSLSLFIPEKGEIICLLVNSLGQCIQVKDREPIEPGKQQFEIDSQLLAPGQYILLIRFTTQNHIINKQLKWIIE